MVLPGAFIEERVRYCGWKPNMRRLHGDLRATRFERTLNSFSVRVELGCFEDSGACDAAFVVSRKKWRTRWRHSR